MTDQTKCGKVAGALIPRLGMWYACVLDPGHEGDCRRGGNCFKHGEYVGELCPHWPECISVSQLLGKDVAAGVERQAYDASIVEIPMETVDLEEKEPCGHRKANMVGDEGGTPYCEVCKAIEDTRKEMTQAAPGGVPRYRNATPAEKDRQRAQEFQHRLDSDVSSAVGDRVWWASIRFPDVLAAEFAQVRMEAIVSAQEEKNWIFKNAAGTVEIDFPGTLRAVRLAGRREQLEAVAGYLPDGEYQARKKALE